VRTTRRKSWRRPAGVTLVEAVAGTLVLGTLLVSVLTAKVQLDGQARRAAAKIAACEVLDGLLNGWWADPDGVPLWAQGEVPSHAGWRWRTRVPQRLDAKALQAKVVAVEVFAPGQTDKAPAAAVEILIPLSQDETKETRQGNDAG
jgi:hypothetical protein